MALINCSECGREISDQAATCPGCGAPINPVGQAFLPVVSEPKTKKRYWNTPRLIVAAFMCIAGFSIFYTYGEASRSNPIYKSGSDPPPRVTPVNEIVTVEDFSFSEDYTFASNTKFIWGMRLKNSGPTRKVSVTISFKDKDGYVIETDTEHGVVVPGNSSKRITTYSLVDANNAREIKRASVRVHE